MTNILNISEAALYCRTDEDDALMLQLMDAVDSYVETATGRDWTQDASVNMLAKAAASMLLVSWYDNPAQIGTPPSAISGVLLQLEAEALKYRKYWFEGLTSSGGIAVDGLVEGDEVIKLIGVYGVSGDQSANFESIISEDGSIQQSVSSDLSANQYVLVVKHPAEDVGV